MEPHETLTAEYKLASTEAPEPCASDDGEPPDISRWAFSPLDYGLCIVIGIGILWAWQAMLGAAPYFGARFAADDDDDDGWIARHYASAIFAVFAAAILGVTAGLARRRGRDGARFERRVCASFAICIAVSLLVALSTVFSLDISGAAYFAFVLLGAGCVGVANALSQNGVFALVSGFGEPRYAQGVLLGSAMAGISPPISQILIVLWDVTGSVADGSPPSPKKAPLWPLVYFLLSAIVGVISLVAFVALIIRHSSHQRAQNWPISTKLLVNGPSTRKPRGLAHSDFFRKSHYLAIALFICFTITTCSPIFSSKVQSVLPVNSVFSMSQPDIFVPLALLIWNCGELLGSFIPLIRLKLIKEPKIIFYASLARVGFIILYNLCNVEGRGAVVGGDLFYLIVVQGLSGVTSGWIMTACMMSPAEYRTDEDREDAGAFMVFYLIAGLAAGSLLSFAVA